jgi:hypothetical protein
MVYDPTCAGIASHHYNPEVGALLVLDLCMTAFIKEAHPCRTLCSIQCDLKDRSNEKDTAIHLYFNTSPHLWLPQA